MSETTATPSQPEAERRAAAEDAPRPESEHPGRDAVRFAATLWLRPGLGAASWGIRTATWGTRSALAAGLRVARAARDREPPSTLAEEARDALRHLLGVSDIEERLSRLSALRGQPQGDGAAGDPRPLRDRGRELLYRSADLAPADGLHPAFPAILDQLAPDEARILRVLATAGPQPAADVEWTLRLGGGSRIAARRVTMVAVHAGLLHRDRVDAYLDNLERLGLVRVDADAVRDQKAYDLLSAQPEVKSAMIGIGPVKATRMLRRSLRLTRFGSEFCAICLPVEGAGAQGPSAAPE